MSGDSIVGVQNWYIGGSSVVEGMSVWLVFGVRGIIQGMPSWLGEFVQTALDSGLITLGLIFKVEGFGAMGVEIGAEVPVSYFGVGKAGISRKSGAVVIWGKQQHWCCFPNIIYYQTKYVVHINMEDDMSSPSSSNYLSVIELLTYSYFYNTI